MLDAVHRQRAGKTTTRLSLTWPKTCCVTIQRHGVLQSNTAAKLPRWGKRPDATGPQTEHKPKMGCGGNTVYIIRAAMRGSLINSCIAVMLAQAKPACLTTWPIYVRSIPVTSRPDRTTLVTRTPDQESRVKTVRCIIDSSMTGSNNQAEAHDIRHTSHGR
jgi:hypothetical protein